MNAIAQLICCMSAVILFPMATFSMRENSFCLPKLSVLTKKMCRSDPTAMDTTLQSERLNMSLMSR